MVAFEGDGRVERVACSDGAAIDCDAVVVGVGAAPRTELAEAAGLAVENGVLVDGRLETSVPGIFAAGDVANHLHPVLGRLRVEHWDNALHQGPAAARAHARRRTRPTPACRTSSPTSTTSGWSTPATRPAGIGSSSAATPRRREFIAFWLAGGRVRGRDERQRVGRRRGRSAR